MATILYKDGKQIAVNYDALKRHLAAGWSTSESPKPEAEAENNEVNADAKPKPKRRATRKKAD